MHSRFARLNVAAAVALAAVAAGFPSVSQAASGPSSLDYEATILADHPFIYWRLDDTTGSGQMADASGNGNVGVYSNSPSPILERDSLINGDSDPSVRFATNSYATWEPGSQAYSGPFSVEAWIETGRNAGEHTFFSTRSAADLSFDLKLSTQVQGRGIRVDVGDGSTRWFVTETVPFKWRDNTRYAVVAVATNFRVTIYVDGAPIGSVRYTDAIGRKPLLFDYSHVPQVGMTNGYQFFSGRIDELAVYEYALSADQVTNHFQAGIAP